VKASVADVADVAAAVAAKAVAVAAVVAMSVVLHRKKMMARSKSSSTSTAFRRPLKAVSVSDLLLLSSLATDRVA
jgi:hypothetical protein